MKKSILVVACLLGLAAAAQAQQTVTLLIDAGQLLNTTGTAGEPVGGLLQLLASPTGVFGAPTAGSYVSGDDVVLSSFAMNNGGGTNETFNQVNFALSTTTTTPVPGEKVELRFYPGLTFATMPAGPTAGVTYGQVRSDSIEFGPAGGVATETAWVIPSGGSQVNLEYVTVSNGGTYANTTAFATGLVVAAPEPSTCGIISGALMSLMCVRAWKRRSAGQSV